MLKKERKKEELKEEKEEKERKRYQIEAFIMDMDITSEIIMRNKRIITVN